MPVTRIVLLGIAALALVAAGPASARSKPKPRTASCGAYAQNDGSLADGVVTRIVVARTSCALGQRIAGAYAGQVGKLTAAGFSCLAYQGSGTQSGTVQCKKRAAVVRYTTAPMTDC